MRRQAASRSPRPENSHPQCCERPHGSSPHRGREEASHQRRWCSCSLSTPTLLPLAHGSPCVPPQATSCHRLLPGTDPRGCAHRLQRGRRGSATLRLTIVDGQEELTSYRYDVDHCIDIVSPPGVPSSYSELQESERGRTGPFREELLRRLEGGPTTTPAAERPQTARSATS